VIPGDSSTQATVYEAASMVTTRRTGMDLLAFLAAADAADERGEPMLPPLDELPPVPDSDDEHDVPAESTGMEVDSVAAGGMECESGQDEGGIELSPTEPFDPVHAKAAFESHMRGESVAGHATSGPTGSSASAASGSTDGPAVLRRERPSGRRRTCECTSPLGVRALPPTLLTCVITPTAGEARNPRSLTSRRSSDDAGMRGSPFRRISEDGRGGRKGHSRFLRPRRCLFARH
jgi:hypothetical protein